MLALGPQRQETSDRNTLSQGPSCLNLRKDEPTCTVKVGALRSVLNCLRLPGLCTRQDGSGGKKVFSNETLYYSEKNIPIIMRLSSPLLLLSAQKSKADSYVSALAHIHSPGCCHHDES